MNNKQLNVNQYQLDEQLKKILLKTINTCCNVVMVLGFSSSIIHNNKHPRAKVYCY